MNKIERLKKMFEGKHIDRAPATIFYHFGQQYNKYNVHAQLEIDFYKHFDVDVLKIMNDYSYPMPAGLKYVKDPDDIKKFDSFEIEHSAYGEQLKCVKIITSSLKKEVTCWDTVFNPWFTVRRNILRSDINHYMQHHQEQLLYLLEKVTKNLIAYAKKSISMGISGLFYSVPASQNYLTYEQYLTFMKPFDFQFIEGVRSRVPMFIAHIHGEGKTYFDDIANYSIDGISWADRQCDPGLNEAMKRYSGILMGGINHAADFNYRPFPVLKNEIEEALSIGGAGRFILAPGCVLPTQCPAETLSFVMEVGQNRENSS